MSSNMYDNLPLKTINRELDQQPSHKIKTIQNTLMDDHKQKKRKSTPEVTKVSDTARKPKASRSLAEMFFKNHNQSVEICEKLSPSRESFGSSDTLKASNNGNNKLNNEILCKSDEDLKKMTNVQSTPTSTLDDGYESSNSTPLVSGKNRQIYVLLVICMLYYCKRFFKSNIWFDKGFYSKF